MPDKMIVRSWAQLQGQLMSGANPKRYDMVSFDVFDTLLARIDTPEQIQRATCRLLAKRLQGDYTVEQVWESRQCVERTLRALAVEKGFDPECRFSALVPRWLNELTGLAEQPLTALIDWVIGTELELEQQALYVKPGVIDFLQWLSGQGIRLYAISDMYLDGQYIRELLVAKKLADYFEQIYVSADNSLGKYSGRLFQHVSVEQGLSYSSWLHVGDNPVSDRRAACELGIQGVWLYEKPALREREQQQLSVAMAARGGLWKGQRFFSVLQQRLRAQQSLSPEDNVSQRHNCDRISYGGNRMTNGYGDKGSVSSHGDDSFYFRYGRDVLGGAFSTFTLGLHERLRRKPVDKVLFVARDGFLFREMYHQLGEQLNKRFGNHQDEQRDQLIEDEYVYLSRKVITAASTADGLTLEQAQVAFYNPKQQGLKSLCNVYGLPEGELAALALQHGFSDFSAALVDWQDQRLKDFLADEQVQEVIKPIGAKHRALLQGYLEQVGFFSAASIALVDIGWNGTVQKFLKQAFGERADFPRVHGYYFAFVPKMYNDFGVNNFCEGIIHDSRRDNACERIPAEFEEIFEQGARAQGATTIAYQRAGDLIKPVFKDDDAPDRQAELACNARVAAMQRGVMTHWQHFLIVQQLTGYSSIDLLPYVYGQLERAIVYPSREESGMLTRLVHTEDFGDDHVLDLGQEAVGWRDILRPVQLWQRLRGAAWRYALFAGLPTGIANFAFRMVYLHAVKK